MESQIGLYKTELIKPRGPWRSLADVELATAEWVAWFNTTRLHSAIGHLPAEEFEAIYYAQYQPSEPVGINRLHQSRGGSESGLSRSSPRSGFAASEGLSSDRCISILT
ncbi:integrase-like protein [Nonomuraea polychroma]|uniref:Integrase-like protein n=1 Tax=Nonomuraea polychroma TaxID=46176 RepID=A0A438MKP3_9ACTN|nr:integrase core domain-containing protein [Nonomuraea polychroma]RVX46272.1 integrase-like protein [Nonomuraea polychroma]